MHASRKCPHCGQELKADSVSGHCTFRLLLLGLGPTSDNDEAEIAEKPGDWLGKYQLQNKIGEGGYGVVYQAQQVEPIRRQVAVKIIKLGMDTTAVIERFEAERQALAILDHANIAKVYDAGSTNIGRSYFVMELVNGKKITDFCNEKKFSTKERLDLFIQVCRAIQHAHQKGIIHRDIKPSNILVIDQDGVVVPKIIDFGIAKATPEQRLNDHSVFTAIGQFVGTPAYMSPEQASLGSMDIDTRSDVYSLGALLYELLTGQQPLDGEEFNKFNLDAILRALREKEPLKPSARLLTLSKTELENTATQQQSTASKLPRILSGDLDWIVIKALQKERTRRYETANGLAMDIIRHLKNEPVMAGPPSKLYLFEKSILRNKWQFGIAVSLFVALVTWMWGLQIRHAEKLSRELRQLQIDALSLWSSGDLTDAETDYRKVESVQIRLFGQMHQDVVETKHNLFLILL